MQTKSRPSGRLLVFGLTGCYKLFLPIVLPITALIGPGIFWILLRHLVVCAQAFQLLFQPRLDAGKLAAAIDALQLVRIGREIEHFPVLILVKMDQLIVAVRHTVVAGHAVGTGEFIVVIVEMGAPILGGMALE